MNRAKAARQADGIADNRTLPRLVEALAFVPRWLRGDQQERSRSTSPLPADGAAILGPSIEGCEASTDEAQILARRPWLKARDEALINSDEYDPCPPSGNLNWPPAWQQPLRCAVTHRVDEKQPAWWQEVLTIQFEDRLSDEVHSNTEASHSTHAETGSTPEAEEDSEISTVPVGSSRCASEAELPSVETSYSIKELLRWRSSLLEQAADSTSLCRAVDATALDCWRRSVSNNFSTSSPSGRQQEDCRDVCFKQWVEYAVWCEDRSEPETKLQASDTSWLAQQRLRRSCVATTSVADEEVARSIKSILNKLTIEKFPQLYQQLIQCGISKSLHIELLINELFEKATTQHHFIDMYADLCAKLNDFFVENPIDADDPKTNFKKILLTACQLAFERSLTPPAGLDLLDPEERVLEEMRHKLSILGNIRLVGALLTRKMLASKVLLAIVDELLTDPTAATLESLAALLTVVGPVFDVPSWPYRVGLKVAFEKVQGIVQNKATDPRVLCLLLDVLDLRAAAWKDRKPLRIARPSTLEDVAHGQAQEEAEQKALGETRRTTTRAASSKTGGGR